eukprot:9859304-Alexandrium_andersonii.AAC.1
MTRPPMPRLPAWRCTYTMSNWAASCPPASACVVGTSASAPSMWAACSPSSVRSLAWQCRLRARPRSRALRKSGTPCTRPLASALPASTNLAVTTASVA